MNNCGPHGPTNVCRKVSIMAIAICSMLAVIGVYYVIIVSKASSTSGPYHQVPVMTIDVVNQSINEFKLQFKALYVLRFQSSVDSKFAKLKNLSVDKSRNAVNRSSAHDEFPSWQSSECYTQEVDSKACQCSEARTTENVFYCSDLQASSDNIFFLEMSCASDHRWDGPEIHLGRMLPLSEKQTCSIYSAAYHNPSRKVTLLFTCPIPDGFNLMEEWKVLFDLPNFYFSRVDVAAFYANTSLSDFYDGRLALSSFPAPHQADIFRLIVLYLYGGTYMDLDVISLKSLDDLGVNFAGHVGYQLVSNSVMNFEPGHRFLKACMFNAILNYKPNHWGSIGPFLVTETLKSLCNVSEDLDPKSLLRLASCNVTVLPVNTFFAVSWHRWRYFYNAEYWPSMKNLLYDSHAAHYWNHMGHLKLVVGSNQPIVELAMQHCTPVYDNAGTLLD